MKLVRQFLLFRSVVLRRTWLRKLRAQFHGACGRPQSVPFFQLPLRPEHPETDAGERNRTQRFPPGHVQEKVKCNSNGISYRSGVGIWLKTSIIYRFRNFHDDVMPNVMLKVTANIVFGYAT